MLLALKFDTEQWAEENFADAELGDKRRSKRLVKVASQFVDAPVGVEPIHWILLTTLEVADLDAAMRIIGYYELRWLIDEPFDSGREFDCSFAVRLLPRAITRCSSR